MANKIQFSSLKDDVYESIYPIICEVMEENGYTKRSPNWWLGSNVQLPVNKIKDYCYELVGKVVSEKEFREILTEFIHKLIEERRLLN